MEFLVGDIQGCAGALENLLAETGFSPSRDRLYVLGDLVNRGPDSLGVLRRLRDLGDAARCVLGNHDWHLLAVAAGVRPRHRSDTLDDILDAPERDAWLDWLRHRPMAIHAQGWLMLHAGVVPQWDLALTLHLAAEFGKQNIRVNTVAPGIIRTPMHGDRVDSMAGLNLVTRVGESEDVAQMVYTIAKGNFINGAIINVDGGAGAGHHLN